MSHSVPTTTLLSSASGLNGDKVTYSTWSKGILFLGICYREEIYIYMFFYTMVRGCHHDNPLMCCRVYASITSHCCGQKGGGYTGWTEEERCYSSGVFHSN